MNWQQRRNYWLLVAADNKSILDQIHEYPTGIFTLYSNKVQYSSLEDAKAAAEALHS